MQTIQQRFDANWLASRSKDEQDLFNLAHAPNVPFTDNSSKALALHEAGVMVDLAIIVYGWSPYLVHLERTNAGVPYVSSLAGIGVDPTGIVSSGQAPLWQFPPWDRSKFPPNVLPSVWVDPGDDEGTLKRLGELYPVPTPPVPVASASAFNPIGLAWGIRRDITAPDGSVYKDCPIFNGPPGGTGVDGEYYTAADGKRYLLQVTRGLMGPTKLWFLLPAAVKA